MKQHNLAELITRLRCRCEKTDEEIRKKTPLSPAEYRALLCLQPKECVTAADFSERMELSASRGSRVIEKLCEHDYIIAERSEDDRRRVMISLGSRGLAIKKSIAESLDECNRLFSKKLSEPQIETIRESVENLIEILDGKGE